MAKRDYYELLGVEHGADAAAIKKAFRKLARELHPDVNREDPAAEERFKEAAEAYEVLSDPERRRTYDAFGHEGLRTGGYQPGGAGVGSIQDIFESIFGGEGGGLGEIFGGGARGPASGGDLGVSIEIPLTEVLTGTTREVEFEAVIACDHCHGNGAEPGTPIISCETCGGAGQVRQVTQTAFGQMMRTGSCPTCSGAGKIAETPCEVCAGRGRRLANRGWDVDIPAGIEHGQRIRISGAGHEGEVGGRSGDLYVEVAVEPSEDFHREGRDLLTVVELSVTAAMLGATTSVPTLEGEVEVEVAPGAQHGETIKLRGQGLPGLKRATRGDLHVVLKLITPVKLDEEQRELLERLEASLGERNEPQAAKGGLFERVRRAFR
jgi:molecular chaperone DnaJ